MSESFLLFCSDKEIPYDHSIQDPKFQMNPGNLVKDLRALHTPIGPGAGMLARLRVVVRGRWGIFTNTFRIIAHITKNGVLLPETKITFETDGALWVTTHSKEVFPKTSFTNEDTIGLNIETINGQNDPTRFYVSAVAVFQH